MNLKIVNGSSLIFFEQLGFEQKRVDELGLIIVNAMKKQKVKNEFKQGLILKEAMLSCNSIEECVFVSAAIEHLLRVDEKPEKVEYNFKDN